MVTTVRTKSVVAKTEDRVWAEFACVSRDSRERIVRLI